MMGFGLGGVGMVLLWLIMAAIVVLILRGLMGRSSREHRPSQSASEILRRRYAAGDITTEEFKRRQQALEDAR